MLQAPGVWHTVTLCEQPTIGHERTNQRVTVSVSVAMASSGLAKFEIFKPAATPAQDVALKELAWALAWELAWALAWELAWALAWELAWAPAWELAWALAWELAWALAWELTTRQCTT
jgi:hypothetical protein